MALAAHSEHVGPKSSLGSDDSERIASQFSLTHTVYLPWRKRACGCYSPLSCHVPASHAKNLQYLQVLYEVLYRRMLISILRRRTLILLFECPVEGT